ncbi:MAG: four helix bundle protein [Microgenomates group bacterium]|nr:four helix bundle protein [Microgenomates group bacterium]
MIKSFRDLEVYQESYKLMILIHKKIKEFPIYEKMDLTSQMRRGSKSIPANIAEGWAKRNHEKEFKKHLNIAIGSANEMEVHIETARDLNYLNKDFAEDVLKRYNILGRKLFKLRQNWKSF